ncbi:UNVERIFIED_CONTAM: hypothetical protein Sindi_1222200 [Sesamum indicum]
MGSCRSDGNGASNKTSEMEETNWNEATKRLVILLGVGVGSNERKNMRAPGGRGVYMYRDEFEEDPAHYFRRLRN